jgi:hypothetical protein
MKSSRHSPASKLKKKLAKMLNDDPDSLVLFVRSAGRLSLALKNVTSLALEQEDHRS